MEVVPPVSVSVPVRRPWWSMALSASTRKIVINHHDELDDENEDPEETAQPAYRPRPFLTSFYPLAHPLRDRAEYRYRYRDKLSDAYPGPDVPLPDILFSFLDT